MKTQCQGKNAAKYKDVRKKKKVEKKTLKNLTLLSEASAHVSVNLRYESARDFQQITGRLDRVQQSVHLLFVLFF